MGVTIDHIYISNFMLECSFEIGVPFFLCKRRPENKREIRYITEHRVEQMGFENFEPVFGEPKAEWGRNSEPGSIPLRRFLMHVFAPDYYHLKFHVTDFHFNTFEALTSVLQLEDLVISFSSGFSSFGFLCFKKFFWLDFVF